MLHSQMLAEESRRSLIIVNGTLPPSAPRQNDWGAWSPTCSISRGWSGAPTSRTREWRSGPPLRAFHGTRTTTALEILGLPSTRRSRFATGFFDDDALDQILDNLLDNAEKHTRFRLGPFGPHLGGSQDGNRATDHGSRQRARAFPATSGDSSFVRSTGPGRLRAPLRVSDSVSPLPAASHEHRAAISNSQQMPHLTERPSCSPCRWRDPDAFGCVAETAAPSEAAFKGLRRDGQTSRPSM